MLINLTRHELKYLAALVASERVLFPPPSAALVKWGQDLENKLAARAEYEDEIQN